MASSHQKGNEQSMFTSNSPHFFKIILQDTIRNGILAIPRKFVKKYGNGLSSPAFLRVPTGAVWKVELTKSDGEIWLKNGWQEFSNHYSLEFGNFLVFRYEGNCRFHVLIFGKTATEIEYSYSNDDEKTQQQEVRTEESEDDESVEIINEISTGKRKKPEPQCPRPRKMMRANPAERTEKSLKSESIAAGFKHHNGFSAEKSDEKSKAIKRAKRAFKSKNQPFFVYMQPTYVALNSKRGLCVGIPREFSKDHLKGHGDIILLDSNWRTWPVKYRSACGINRRGYVKLCHGWGAFVRDKNLQVGDVCAFELINCSEISFKVCIFRGKKTDSHESRASTDVSCPAKMKAGTSSARRVCLQEPLKPRETAVERARALTPENPYFPIVLKPSYVRTHALYVPNQFARDHFNSAHTNVEITLCLPNGKSWPAEYHQRSSGRPDGRICKGWKAFVKDNYLKAGDVCVLEMTDDTKISFKVFIFQDTADSSCSPPQGVSQKPSRLTSQSAKAAREKASMSIFFRKVVLPSHLKDHRMDIPFKFVEQHLQPDIQKVILQVEDRSWPVKITINPRHRAAKLTSGWIDFERESSLRDGDICLYELDTVNNC